jgi:hypothetical protein
MPTVTLQLRVSEALQSLPRGREMAPPGERFRRIVFTYMPDIEAMELVDRFLVWASGSLAATTPWRSLRRPDARLDVPGVKGCCPASSNVVDTEQKDWPADQAKLRTLIANAAPGSPTWNTLFKELTTGNTMNLISDLVLIFKYAALHCDRPLRTVAELYQLVRTLLDTAGPARGSARRRQRAGDEPRTDEGGRLGRRLLPSVDGGNSQDRRVLRARDDRTRGQADVGARFSSRTTEVNRHNFTRELSAPDHVSGVYHYLERISRAKIFGSLPQNCNRVGRIVLV